MASECLPYKIPTGSSKLFTPSPHECWVCYAWQKIKSLTPQWMMNEPQSILPHHRFANWASNMQPKIKPHRLQRTWNNEATELFKAQNSGDLKSRTTDGLYPAEVMTRPIHGRSRKQKKRPTWGCWHRSYTCSRLGSMDIWIIKKSWIVYTNWFREPGCHCVPCRIVSFQYLLLAFICLLHDNMQ